MRNIAVRACPILNALAPPQVIVQGAPSTPDDAQEKTHVGIPVDSWSIADTNVSTGCAPEIVEVPFTMK